MKDIIDALGGPRARLLEVHTIDPIPATVTVQRATGATWVDCEVNLTSITPPRQLILRIDHRALQRLAAEAADAESACSTTRTEADATGSSPNTASEA
jgi:hypothetical protein